MPRLIKTLIIFLAVVLALFLVVLCYFFVGKAPKPESITWGVDFSQMQAEALKLNWKEAYLAIIDDLGAKNIKLHTQWDWVEGVKNNYYFDDIDWQLKKAKESNVKIIYVVGIKTGRWPECHVPEWTTSLAKEEQQQVALDYIKETVLRYKDSPAIAYWQVENEPLLNFGECPDWYYSDQEFLQKEVELVKSLDSTRQVIVSDSGELSFWFKAAKVGDILGTTMYRKAWVVVSSYGLPSFIPNFYGTYPISPVHYWRKAQLIKMLYNKKTICIELQAEPWPHGQIYDTPIEEQLKTMDVNQFKKNVEYAKETGLDTFYFWGAEWWYWMKTKQNQPDIWNEAQQLFKSS